MKSSDSLVLR